MPNDFAYAILFGWPLVAVALFAMLPAPKALIWTILGGYLVLPAGASVKFAMIPAIDKSSVPSVSAAILCLIYHQRDARLADAARQPTAPIWAKGRAIIVALLALLFIAPVLSAMTNPEPVAAGPRLIPGLQLYDAFSMISPLLVSIIPFLLALWLLSTPATHRDLAVAFAVAGLIYALPVLFEVRMSPQLQNIFYGFFPHSFLQHIREGGFRPAVFLGHGLLIGMLLAIAILASLTLWREEVYQGRPATGWLYLAAGLGITLFFSKTLGALAITVCIGAVIAFGGRRLQVGVAALVAFVVILYPILRGANLIPLDTVHEMARSISENRAFSLKYRLDNEDALLARANEKPLFGWGSWGRNHIYDPHTGIETSVTDGMWIILIGVYGWLGYIAHFGLLTLPLLFYAYRRKHFDNSLITPGLGLILGATLIDMLPNAGLVPYVWMLAGALAGLALKETSGSVDRVSPVAVAGTAPRLARKSIGPTGQPSPIPRLQQSHSSMSVGGPLGLGGRYRFGAQK